MTKRKVTTVAEVLEAMTAPPCLHHDLQLVEGGYTRTWSFAEQDDGTFVAIFHGLEDFSDDGDGVYNLECSSCLKEFPLPDEWEWS